MPTANQNPQGQQPAKWYTIRTNARATAAGADNGVQASAAEILIYGDIGESWYGDTIAAKDFVRDVAALDVEHLTVRINSYGGSVTDGIAIHNALKRHSAQVTTVIDGIAASIASLIAMAGDTVEMAENAQIMIHAPWGYQVGNSADMREYADMLDSWADAMSTTYASKTGTDKAEFLALLTDGKDHWYTAEQALEAKLIDTVIPGLPVAASAQLKESVKARYASFGQTGTAPATPAYTSSTTAAAAATQPQENTMPGAATQQPAAASQPAGNNEETIRLQALAADGERRKGIQLAFAAFAARAGVAELQTTCCDDVNCSVEQANTKLLAHLGKDATPVAGSYIVTLEDSRDKFRAGAEKAVLARAGMEKDDRANNYRGFTMMELARECLAHAGVNTRGMDKMGMVSAAFTHTSSDFPSLLSNIAEKAMLRGYEEADETFQKWTSKGTLSDFKVARRVGLNTFPSLDQIAEGAEYHYADVSDRGESVVLATFGKLFSLNRQTIINDDLGAFTKIPRSMGRAAIRTIGDLVYAILTTNPKMSDGVALFHANHKNLLDAANAATISTASVDAMRVAMGKQSDGNASALNIRLANLIVPLALEGLAITVRDSQYAVGGANNATIPNIVKGNFDVIADARLDRASPTSWHGVADSGKYDTVEVQYLDGIETPTLEQQNGWNVDGVEFKVRIDAGVKALDYRTLAKNIGA
jgi:ATP-dependent protease ClpP protease subunit/phage major head subunit gpT-like protein